MTTIQHSQYGETFTLEPVFGNYGNGRLAIQMYDSEEGPYSKVTVNVVDAPDLGENEVYVKDWAENEVLTARLVSEGWLVLTGRQVPTGFVDARS